MCEQQYLEVIRLSGSDEVNKYRDGKKTCYHYYTLKAAGSASSIRMKE